MTFIVDASLAVKTFVPEEDSDAADLFVRRWRGELEAPDSLLLEIGNTLVRLANTRAMLASTATALLDVVEQWVQGEVRLHRLTPDLVVTAGKLAIELGHPIKDCIYLALADRLGCPLATCDVRFRDRVADPARVRLLAELV